MLTPLLIASLTTLLFLALRNTHLAAVKPASWGREGIGGGGDLRRAAADDHGLSPQRGDLLKTGGAAMMNYWRRR